MHTSHEVLDAVQTEADHGSGAYAPIPVVMVRGQGARLWDEQGKEYLDFGTGIGVAALGHAHPALTRALSEQASRLMTWSTRSCSITKRRYLRK